MFTCTQEEFVEHEDAMEGICLNCGEWIDGVEDDAEEGFCDYCGKQKVVGAGQALVLGKLDIED
jgi:Zn finger protein HypA/HybF involved in hydrogenase expression